MNYDARYHIIGRNGWILSTQDNPPTIEELRRIAIHYCQSVYLTTANEDGQSEEIGYANVYGPSPYDYIELPA